MEQRTEKGSVSEEFASARAKLDAARKRKEENKKKKNWKWEARKYRNKKKKRESSSQIPQSAKKRKKKSKVEVDREERQKQEAATLQFEAVANSNFQVLEYVPCRGGELCEANGAIPVSQEEREELSNDHQDDRQNAGFGVTEHEPPEDLEEIPVFRRNSKEDDDEVSNDESLYDRESIDYILAKYKVEKKDVVRNKSVNVLDLLNCQLPNSPSSIKRYVAEVVKRTWSCIARNQLDTALSIITRGIISCDPLVESDQCFRSELYHMRLRILEEKPDLLDKMQRLHTLQQVMTLSSWDTVSYDMLRSIFGTLHYMTTR